jgi:hypothetical protein
MDETSATKTTFTKLRKKKTSHPDNTQEIEFIDHWADTNKNEKELKGRTLEFRKVIREQ